MRRAEDAREVLDGPVPRATLVASLDDLDRLNRWFGGYRLTLARLARLARQVPPGRPLVVVDVGGGRGDFAIAVAGWARRARRPVRVVVVDRGPALRLGAAVRARYPEVAFVAADAAALPLAERSADAVTASLLLHHLPPDAAAACLGGMAAAARGRVIVSDLIRSRVALVLVWLATRLLRLHPASRHDGPLSVRRAYTPAELRVLAEKAGLRRLVVRRYPWLARLVAESA